MGSRFTPDPSQASGLGEWHMHCHVLGHMMEGIMGSLLIIQGGELALGLPSGEPCGMVTLPPAVVGPSEFPQTILIQPFNRSGLVGIAPTSLRVFCWGSATLSLRPVWNSGINLGHGYVWAKILRPGVYILLGLPCDRLLYEAIRSMAHQRRYADQASPDEMEAITESALALFMETSEDDLEASRQALTAVEVQTSLGPSEKYEIRRGRGGYIQSFPLPHGASLAEFKDRLSKLEPPPGGLPEETLFYRPELLQARGAPPRLNATRTHFIWSSPLVVNGKVYVGCGEGEYDAFGFVYCLDADTGNVIWLFCTNKLAANADNSPNVIPNSAIGASPLPAGFTQGPDPSVKGVSI